METALPSADQSSVTDEEARRGLVCQNPGSPQCRNPSTAFESCIQGRGDCQGYATTCDCNYHKPGCTISMPAPRNTACECGISFISTCGGEIVSCSNFSSTDCRQPSASKDACLQGGGNCSGYP
jgi:hypothetical protein